MQPFNRILLVDDDEAIIYLSQVLLKEIKAAKEIATAEDGLAAYQLIKEHQCPDVIFLDIRMPRMDGFQFIDCLIKTNVCNKAKIVILSSSLRQEDKQKAFTYKQVIGYLEKPLTKEIVERIARDFGKV